MLKITNKQLHLAFLYWDGEKKFSFADEVVQPYLSDEIENFLEAPHDWLRLARNASLLSSNSLAEKLGMTRSAYIKLEKSEQAGTISLKTLQRAAEAMDCELVYAVRPKRRLPFSRLIWRRVLEKALPKLQIRPHREQMRGQALAAIAKDLIEDIKFRRDQGWSQR